MRRKNKRNILAAAVLAALLCCGCSGQEPFSEKTAGDEEACKITDLTVNYMQNPIGIEQNPLFGWRMQAKGGQQQTAYRIVVAASQEKLAQEEYLWDSGRTESGSSVAVPYQGNSLLAGTGYVWKVFVWDEAGNMTESMETAAFETGLTDNDWGGASWIGIRAKQDTKEAAKEKTYYAIEYDVRLGRTRSGVVWGMDTNQYGDYFRCEFDTLGDTVSFSIVSLSNVDEIKRSSADLEEGLSEDFGEKVHHVRLEIKDTAVEASIDGKPVLHTELDQKKALGNLGFWTDRGAYYAYYDNLCVTDGDTGEVLLQEDFEEDTSGQKKNTLFSPYYFKVRDGWCEASSGFLLTPGVNEPAPMLRCLFEKKPDCRVTAARLYVSALGDYRIYLDGEEASGEYLAPGRSIYSKEVYYQTYDVTKLLADEQTQHVLGAVLGHGRYDKANADWGEQIALQAKLVLQYDDHSTQCIVTDDTWQAYADGPIQKDDMFLGEFYDATREQTGWCERGFAADGWQQADVFSEYDALEKRASGVPAVSCIETRKPVAVSEPVSGVYVYDFGQNFNGNCELVFRDTEGKRGQTVTIRYAEALNDSRMSCRDDAVGTVWTQNLYTAKNTDYYVMSGAGEETYTPKLVCRGFRYVQISGVDEALPAEEVTGLVLSTKNKRTGYFTCSDEHINQLYESIYWTQLSNFLDVPTDCPQRDERFGWAGDAQVFARTAAYNAEVHNYLSKYVQMLIDGQCENGAFPEIAPSINMDSGANGWSDAGIILVWELYQQYGDQRLIEDNLQAMCRYMDYLVDTSENFVRRQHNYSDHNAVAGLEDEIANTAQCAYVAGLLSKMSADIGEKEIALTYEKVYNQYRAAWQENYINEDGSIDCWLQSAYTLGLAYGLYPEALAKKGAACLNNAVMANDYHLNTGYIGTQFLLPVLCRYGYVDTAYRILQQDTYPSWRNMLSYGQTTITEAWNTCYETGDGTYAVNGSMNHFGLGTVGQWLYSDVLGIKRDLDNPGYKHFYIEPQVGGGLTHVSGSYESVYGTIESGWRLEGSELVFTFVIPPNTTATVTLPDPQYQNMALAAGAYEYRIALNQ